MRQASGRGEPCVHPTWVARLERVNARFTLTKRGPIRRGEPRVRPAPRKTNAGEHKVRPYMAHLFRRGEPCVCPVLCAHETRVNTRFTPTKIDLLPRMFRIVMLPQHILAEIISRVAPDGMDVVGIVLRVV